MKDLSAYSCSTFKEKDKSNSSKIDANVDSNDRFSFVHSHPPPPPPLRGAHPPPPGLSVVHRRRILVIVLSPPNNSPNTERCDCPTNQFSYGSMLDLLAEQIHLPPLEV